jgi:hypothetical protein
MSKRFLRQTGVTEDGRRVMGGVFEFYSTRGVSLDILLAGMVARGFEIDWLDLFDRAVNEGKIKPPKALVNIESAMRESCAFQPERVDEILGRLKSLRPND